MSLAQYRERKDRTPSPPPEPRSLLEEAKELVAEPEETRHTAAYYKLVCRRGDQLLSIYDGRTSYKLNTTIRQRVTSTGGGFFVYRTAEEALKARFPASSALYIAPRVMLKVAAWGESRSCPGNALVFGCMCPLEVLPLPSGYYCNPLSARSKFGQAKLDYTLKTARRDMVRFRSTNFEETIFSNRLTDEREHALKYKIRTLANRPTSASSRNRRPTTANKPRLTERKLSRPSTAKQGYRNSRPSTATTREEQRQLFQQQEKDMLRSLYAMKRPQNSRRSIHRAK